MQKISIFLIGLLLISNYVISQYRLDIEITALRSNEGVIMLQLFNENQKVIDQQKKIIKNNKSYISFNDLKPGIYGIRFYHDENISGEMETNLLGKPTEGYGFSNNVTGKSGPPSFEKWLFELKENKKIKLKPLY